MTKEATPEPGNILGRLDKLERQNRRFRLALILVGITVCAALLTAKALPASQTVVAQRFLVADANGTIRAGLGLSSYGVPSLIIADGAGKPRVALTLWST
jgi:hypothetical protein